MSKVKRIVINNVEYTKVNKGLVIQTKDVKRFYEDKKDIERIYKRGVKSGFKEFTKF